MLQVLETYNGFELQFDYNVYIIKSLKAVGGRWNAGRKVWWVSKDAADTVAGLQKRFGSPAQLVAPEQFGIIPELPELNIEIPLKRPLFPFQGKGVAYTLQHKKVIIGDEPGLGKTSQAIAAIVAANEYPALIVCPSSLKINWEREFMEVAGIKAMILTDRVKTSWQQYWKVGMIKVFIVNYESLKKFFVASINKTKDEPLKLKHIVFRETINLFKTVVFDELHKCKDGSTRQAKLAMGIARGKELILGLTGTPVVNKPKDLISQLYIIEKLQEFGGYKTFMNRYCGGNGTGATNLKELHYKLATTCFYQRQKKDVLQELPDKMRQIVLCELTPNAQKEYNAALNDLANYLQQFKDKTNAEIEKSMRGEIMVRIGICKNISARGKISDVIEHIDEVTESGQKIVVFIHQKEIATALLAHYPKAVSVRGDDDMESRQRSVDSFQRDAATKIIICSIKAAGVGITLTASSRVAFVELPWHAADCNQCEDRCHRIGQHDSVQCTYFLGKDTIDEDIYKIIEEKRAIANTVTGTEDNTQKEIIDKITSSLFNKKALEEA